VGARTEYRPGTFCWVELATADLEAARAFYPPLLGWQLEDDPISSDEPYLRATVGGRPVAAMFNPPSQRGGPASWASYVSVEDADATAARAKDLGGRVVMGPFDVRDAARIAVIQDPQGAVLGLWQPRETAGAGLVNDVGALTLNQLNTSDPAAARSFYTGLFGWSFETVMEEPAYWGIQNDGALNGGMMPIPDGSPASPHWLAYFTSGDLEESARRIAENGGRVIIPATSIPSGRFLMAADPQGAAFALFEGEVDP
jgi:predicted enzyme related to lactoylglutathione lyase